MRLAGKVALVTGGAAGIGLGIARRFAAEGVRVVVADLRGAMEAAAEFGGLGVTMDVTSEASVEAGVAAAVERFGGVDVLVSNAGIQHIASVDEMAYADWKRVIDVHLDGAFLTTRACLRAMYAAGRGGTVIYMGSVHSKMASVLKGPYVTAKHGIVGLCRVVAKEGAKHGVRANVICPGFVRTALVEKQIPEQAARLGISEEDVVGKVMLRDTVDGEFTTTEELGDVAVFLAEQKSLVLTGQSILVSHGWGME